MVDDYKKIVSSRYSRVVAHITLTEVVLACTRICKHKQDKHPIWRRKSRLRSYWQVMAARGGGVVFRGMVTER